MIKAQRFNITVLVRKPPIDIPESCTANVIVKTVDFTSAESLTSALAGQDALIDATFDGADPGLSIRLVDAAVAAGVKHVIPSEFSGDPENSKARALPPFQPKSATYKHLCQLGRENKITWSAVCNNAFLDWGLRMSFLGIDLKDRKIEYLNGGKLVIPWTMLDAVGTAVANLLSLDDTGRERVRNRVCYIYSMLKSQKEVADLAKEALRSDRDRGDGAREWTEENLDMEKVLGEAMGEMKAGNVTFKVIGDMIRYSISTPGFTGVPKVDDNELLGVKTLTDQEVNEVITKIAGEMK